MALFKYFQPMKSSRVNVCEQASSIVSTCAASGILGVSESEVTKVAEELNNMVAQSSNSVGKNSHVQYAEKDKIRISHYAILHGNRQTVSHFAKEFPRLDESCVRRRASKYKYQLVH